jgi:CDGSH-type Zn-finger protein
LPSEVENKPKIQIIKNGPYFVTGNVPLNKVKIVANGNHNEYQPVKEYHLKKEYALCRCGQSSNPPYCDGAHTHNGFRGVETASRLPYAKRARILQGPDLDLLDDGRCAYTRFCHREEGNVWELTRYSDDPKAREQAIIAACDCPTGRLIALDREGNPIEPVFEPSIEILEDLEEGVSGPLFVKGYIAVESADGTIYEVRNRITLCRCGQSENKPFCDATHISVGFSDEKQY